MLVFFEKENEEGIGSKRGILALKFFKIWKGGCSISTFIVMREQFEKEMDHLCLEEIEQAHMSCIDTKQFLLDLSYRRKEV